MALQENRDIKRITIVGGGTSGYLAAFHLAHTYPTKHITWIYPQENTPIGVGEALVPDVSEFLNNIGITHRDIIRDGNGTIKLGIKFDDWKCEGHSYTFPFGVGKETVSYNSASLDRMMETGLISQNLLEYPDISTHFRATEILEYLDNRGRSFDNLTIRRETTSADELAGSYDLLIDSTGFRRSILNKPDNFKSIKHLIPNDRAFVYRHEYTDRERQQLPYTRIKAMTYGWVWNIPLGNQFAMGYVHDSKYDVKDEFVSYVNDTLGIDVDPSAINEVRMVTGRNIVHMENNVVAIGLASSFIEPLESTGLYFTTSALRKLCRYIDGELTEAEYNQSINSDFDAVVDFIIAHYKYSDRTNEYWDHYKNLDIELYKPIDIFPPEAWDYVLSAFIDVERPKSVIDPRELLQIHRGTPYHEWIRDARNFT